KPIQRRRGGPLLKQRHGPKVVRDEMHAAVEFRDATGRHAVGRAHLVIRKPPFSRGRKSSVMLDSTALAENRKRGFFAAVTSKKKIPFCPFNRLSSPPHPRMVLVEFRWQWCGSLPVLPGGGKGTTLMTSPYLEDCSSKSITARKSGAT